MVKSIDCFNKYGTPTAKNKFLKLLVIPKHLQIEHLPNKIFCNIDLHEPFQYALAHLISTGCANEIKTFDGCFNIRKMRNASAMSLHSWGIAIDLNAFENQMFTKGKFSKKFIDCFKSSGFDWGGDWEKRTDPMHFQLKTI